MERKGQGIQIIIDHDLCTSCGACVAICSLRNVEMRFNERRGKWDAWVRGANLCQRCIDRSCLSVCPSYDVDYMELAGSHENRLLGRVRRVYNGYSKDGDLRYSSSSGGFIREACRTLLQEGRIDGVISIVHEAGLDYVPKIITRIEEMPNSIYHNVNYAKAIDLLQQNEGRYLLIGLPCQLTGMELFVRRQKKGLLRERVYAKIALICGFTFDRKNIEAFAYYQRFPLKEVSYRNGGRLRRTQLRNGSREISVEAFHSKTWRDRVSNLICFDPVMTQRGCLYCVDHLGYCADLVVGDAWQKKYSSETEGCNLIISRTERGEEIVSEMKSFHFEKGTLEEILEAQGPNYAFGALGEGMKRARLKGHNFVPNRKRTNQSEDLVVYRLRAKDRFKISIIQPVLRKGRFRLAQWLVILLESKGLLASWLRP